MLAKPETVQNDSLESVLASAEQLAIRLERDSADALASGVVQDLALGIESRPLNVVVVALEAELAPRLHEIFEKNGDVAWGASSAAAPVQGFSEGRSPNGVIIRFVENYPETGSDGSVGGLLAEADVVMAAGRFGAGPDRRYRISLMEISHTAAILMPVVLDDAPDSPPRAPDWTEWWANLETGRGCLLLSPAGLSTALKMPKFLAEPQDPLALVLKRRGAAARLGQLVELMDQILQEKVARVRARRKQDTLAFRQLEEQARGQDVRNALDRLRNEVTDSIDHLYDSLEDATKKQLLPNGALTAKALALANSFSSSDFARETTTLGIRIQPEPAAVARVQSALRGEIQRNVKTDVTTIRKKIDTLRESIAGKLTDFLDTPTPIGLSTFDEGGLWSTLSSMIQIDLRHQAELPKRGFVKRFQTARGSVMIILMSLSLVGGFIGFRPRQLPIVGVIVMIIFIVSFHRTYKIWEQEDNERIEKEVKRLRESLGPEIRRTVSEVEREKMMRIRAYLDDLKKELARRFDEVAKELLENKAREVERSRREVQNRLRVLEQSLKEFSGIESAIVALRGSGRNVISAAMTAAAAAAGA